MPNWLEAETNPRSLSVMAAGADEEEGADDTTDEAGAEEGVEDVRAKACGAVARSASGRRERIRFIGREEFPATVAKRSPWRNEQPLRRRR